jgi:hypothetical protein
MFETNLPNLLSLIIRKYKHQDDFSACGTRQQLPKKQHFTFWLEEDWLKEKEEQG